MLSAVAPIELRVMPGTIQGELFAAWEMPQGTNTAAITDYMIHVSANNGQSWQVVDDGVSASPYASLTGLDPAQSLVVRVAAVVAEETGQWSAYSAEVSPSGANSDNFVEFKQVGDPGNTPDTTGYGTVAEEFRIGKYEITIGQYTEFLNAVAATDTYSLWNASMESDLNIAGISRSGTSGGYSYSVIGPSGTTPAGASSPGNRPITYISWFDAARFANWMHNGQGSGSTETGAYTLVGGQMTGTAPARNPGAHFYIPTENQWYKAAYYKGGGTNGGYWAYATQSDTPPANTIGGGANQANSLSASNLYSVTQSSSYSSGQNHLTDVGAFTNSQSAYGIFDQTGNVWEWNDLDGTAGSSRGVRGGSWLDDVFYISSSDRYTYASSNEFDFYVGFRLASPVNPLSFVTSSIFTSPSAFVATVTGGAVILSWQSPQAAGLLENLGYVVQRSGDGGLTWTTASDSLPASATSYQVTGLQADQQYRFRVAAISTTGVGAFSEAVAPVTTPSAPANLSPTAGNAQVSLAWTAPSFDGGASITDYVVQYSSNNGGNWTTFNRETSTATTATVTGLTNGTAYVFRVAAVNRIGMGDFSTTTAAIVPPNKVSYDVVAGQTLVDNLTHERDTRIIKRGSGTLILDRPNTHTGGVSVEEGTIVIRDPAALGSGVLTVGADATVRFEVGTATIPLAGLAMGLDGRLDVGTGGLVIAPGGIDPDAVRPLLLSGRSNIGSWANTTTGIGSWAATRNSGFAVGYAVVQDGSTVIAFAALGDANLDGSVNTADVNALVISSLRNPTGTDHRWQDGDFDYDGRITSADVNQLLATGLLNTGPYQPPSANVQMASLATDVETPPVGPLQKSVDDAISTPLSTKRILERPGMLPRNRLQAFVDLASWMALQVAETTVESGRGRSKR